MATSYSGVTAFADPRQDRYRDESRGAEDPSRCAARDILPEGIDKISNNEILTNLPPGLSRSAAPGSVFSAPHLAPTPQGIAMTRAGLTFSHFSVFVVDLPRMEDFYVRVLEFTVTDKGALPTPNGPRQLTFLSRDPDAHHQIVLASGRPAELDFNVINQLSFKADSLTTLKTMYKRVQQEATSGLNPVTHGNSLSLYFHDPEGNRVELYIDLPWYVLQPLAAPLDLDADEDEIMASAERHARALPGFKSRAEWRSEMAQRMGLS
jgi:catechol 2,3-dioxygenase-like lactoylglutathione lyase family enzyme